LSGRMATAPGGAGVAPVSPFNVSPSAGANADS
jgi:hypothetical protein